MMPLDIVQPRAVLDDPHACTDSSDVLGVFGALFDALVRRGPTGYEPNLATGWEMSEDARSTLFTLREGVRFHDGEACDAAAIKHCLERMARPDMGATLGAPGVYSQYLAGMSIDILDAHRLRVTTATPLADILDVLHVGHIVSPRALAEAGEDLGKRAVGTGPYRLESLVPGTEIVAVANTHHHGAAPTHARIRWRGEPSADARLAALLAGDAHVANGIEHAVPAADVGNGFTRIDYLAPTAIIMMFNCAEGPGADPRVRLALNLAIDRAALIDEVLDGWGQPLHGYVSPHHEGFDPEAGGLPHDPARARSLLREAGHGAGLVLETYCPTRLPDEAQQLVAALARQLADLGVSFRVHLDEDRVRYANQVRLKNIHDICVFDSSPMSCFRVLYEKIDSRVRGSWWEGYSNREVERLLDLARRTVSRERRLAIHREVYRLLQADPPWLYLYNHRRVVGLKGTHSGFHMRGDGVLDVRHLPPAPGRG
jgi:peptide/nickel transport system substrate-binding protein